MRSDEIKDLRTKLTARYPGEPTQEFQPLTDRIRRALSWMEKAHHSKRDSPVRFVELWIALNALYGQQPSSEPGESPKERKAFAQWASAIAELDASGALVDALDASDVDSLVGNRYLCHACWNGDPSYSSLIAQDRRRTREALREGRVADVLVNVFQRVLVLRNQIVHGSAAENTTRNRDALEPAVRVLSAILPVATRLMIENGAAKAWTPVYPARGTPHHPWPATS